MNKQLLAQQIRPTKKECDMVKSDKTRPVSFKVITKTIWYKISTLFPPHSCLLQSSELCWCRLRYHSPPALCPASPYGYLTRTQITGFLHKLYGLEWKSEWQTCSVMISKVPHGLSMRQGLTKVGSNIDAEIPIHIISKYSCIIHAVVEQQCRLLKVKPLRVGVLSCWYTL